jgi:hypothetical protein
MTTEILQASTNIPSEIFCYEAMYPYGTTNECEMNPLLAYKASTDPDMMYLHEAMHELDSAEFLKAMQEEVEAQMQNRNYFIM